MVNRKKRFAHPADILTLLDDSNRELKVFEENSILVLKIGNDKYYTSISNDVSWTDIVLSWN